MAWIYKLYQDGLEVARVEASTQPDAEREIMHYVSQYAQDGPVEIRPTPECLKALMPPLQRT